MEIQYIFMLVLGCVTFCYGQVEIPTKCAAVLCEETFCPNPVIRKGECCPICFQDCRVIRCARPPENCESIVPPGGCCPGCNPLEKPGTCPQLRNPFGHCAQLCSSDQSCQGQQKCCSNGCGRVCTNPVKKPIEKPGTCPQLRNPFGHCAQLCSSDQSCQGRQKCCSNGCGRVCTNPVKKPREKPGTCPQLRNQFGHCAQLCSSDQSCQGQQKCCSNGCGRVCMNPVKKPTQPDCLNVKCPPLPPRCRSIKPRGQCCAICRGNRGYRGRRRNRD